MMMETVVPLVAEQLIALPPSVQETLDLAIELHRSGFLLSYDWYAKAIYYTIDRSIGI